MSAPADPDRARAGDRPGRDARVGAGEAPEPVAEEGSMLADGTWGGISTVHLVRGAQAGTAGARDELFQRYSGRVLAIVRARLGPRLRRGVESDDIAQDALIEALESLDRYESRPDSSLIRWLAQIVQHRISARARYLDAERRSSAREVAIDPHGSDGRGAIDPASSGETPSFCMRRAEEQEIVEDCLHALPEAYRELILLRDYAEASWDDVAAATGAASADAARMMHGRARIQLAKLLSARGLG